MSCCCDDLNQTPAMADHDHQQPIMAFAAGPREQIAYSVAFMDEIMAELKGAVPDVRGELVRLLRGLGNDDGADDDDAVAVLARAAELLRGHPDVLRRFVAHVHMGMAAPAEQGLALTTPRRRRSSRRRSERRDTLAAAPPESPPPNFAQALTFVKRVRETAGPVVHGRFMAVLAEAEQRGEDDMFADEVYDGARRAFGPAHVGLLHALAAAWLPGEREWKLQQQAAARQRSRPRAAAATTAVTSHSHAGMHHAKKKPRAADGDGNDGQRHDRVVAVMEARNVKKRRRSGDADDGDGNGTASGRHVLQGVGESSGVRAAAPVLGAGVHHAYIDSDKKPPRRRAAIGGKSSSAAGAAAGPPEQQQPERDDVDEEVRRFRREWEFQTWYSNLVATSDRVAELLRGPHGDDVDRSLEALFPLPECREFLRNCYGGRWGEMAAALERGESRVLALEAIARSLATKQEEAVVEESRRRCRHDPARVAQGLHGLAAAMDTLDEECRRRHHGAGGA